jgi:predicted translin family RNA/ssDNA-binding protein
MSDTGTEPKQSSAAPAESQSTATEHIDEAHRLLTRLRQTLNGHPDLDAAIEKLELALADLNVRTGGML